MYVLPIVYMKIIHLNLVTNLYIAWHLGCCDMSHQIVAWLKWFELNLEQK